MWSIKLAIALCSLPVTVAQAFFHEVQFPAVLEVIAGKEIETVYMYLQLGFRLIMSQINKDEEKTEILQKCMMLI